MAFGENEEQKDVWNNVESEVIMGRKRKKRKK